MAIRTGEYFVHPQETWDKKTCDKVARRYTRDGMGTKFPFPGYVSSDPYGKKRYNGGCIRNGDWYEGEIRHLPIIPEGFRFVHILSWGYRLINDAVPNKGYEGTPVKAPAIEM